MIDYTKIRIVLIGHMLTIQQYQATVEEALSAPADPDPGIVGYLALVSKVAKKATVKSLMNDLAVPAYDYDLNRVWLDQVTNSPGLDFLNQEDPAREAINNWFPSKAELGIIARLPSTKPVVYVFAMLVDQLTKQDEIPPVTSHH